MIGYVGLLRIELPNHTVRLTDGGFKVFDGETYEVTDSVVGDFASVSMMTEGRSGEIPALDLSFNLPSSSGITALSVGALQKSTVKLWLAKYDIDTGLIVGTPDLQFLGQVDQPKVNIKQGIFSLSISAVSKFEPVFQRDIGNSLSAAFQKDLFPGDTGHDNATGLSVSTAWGTSGAGGSSGVGGSPAYYGRGKTSPYSTTEMLD